MCTYLFGAQPQVAASMRNPPWTTFSPWRARPAAARWSRPRPAAALAPGIGWLLTLMIEICTRRAMPHKKRHTSLRFHTVFTARRDWPRQYRRTRQVPRSTRASIGSSIDGAARAGANESVMQLSGRCAARPPAVVRYSVPNARGPLQKMQRTHVCAGQVCGDAGEIPRAE